LIAAMWTVASYRTLARLAEASGDRRGRLAQPRLGARQLTHSRQESTRQPTPARSPTANFVTSVPTAETVPAISCPGTSGYSV